MKLHFFHSITKLDVIQDNNNEIEEEELWQRIGKEVRKTFMSPEVYI